jgi:hypothetical protein
MFRRLRNLAVLLPGLLLPVIVPAAPPVVKVTATSPESPAKLRPQAPLYVRINYQSDEPLRFQLAGYIKGLRRERVMMNPSPAYPAGTGEAVAWLAADAGAQIDEIHVLVHDRNWKLISEVPLAMQAAWTTGAPDVPPAAWAKTLSDAQQQIVSQNLHTANDNPARWSGLLSVLIFTAVPAYPILQLIAFWRLNGGRRILAAVPLLVMLPTYAFCLWALTRDSNLWPIWAIFLSPVAAVYLAVLLMVFRTKKAE